MDVDRGVLAVDIETRSAADLKRVGQWAYAAHESTDVYCVVFGYAEREGRYTFIEWEPGYELPPGLVDFIRAGGKVVAHNASFEISVWRNILEPRYGFPVLDLEQVDDTQIRGLAMNLPMSLDGLAKVLGCPIQKDKEGAALMRKMMVATQGEDGVWANPHDTPPNRERLLDYCRDDVGATLECFYRLKPLDMSEELAYRVDKRINARGVYLDRAFAEDCIALVLERKKELDAEVLDDLTDWRSCMISDSRNPAALKAFLKAHDVEIPTRTRKRIVAGETKYEKTESTDRAAVAEILSREGLHPDVRRVLLNRQESTKATSLAKLGRVADMVGRDGRLRFSLQFHLAGTGRWASSGFQVHNTPKDKLGEVGDMVRQAIRDRDLAALKFLTDRPLEAISSCLRSIICAPPGRELIAADWSAIEARVVAWLAGQADILDVFRRGEDVYVKAAADVGSDDRQLGKICTLALGYGMGVLTFVSTAAGWGVPLTLKEASRIQKAWRKANDAIVSFWRELEEAAKLAVEDPGVIYEAGRIRALSSRGCLALVLPSGRSIRYWKPRIVTSTSTIKIVDDEGNIEEKELTREELRFYSMGKGKGSMVEESTYGGKLAENVTQAVARDLLAAATVRLDREEPYDLVVHVHDSLAAEVPEGEGDVDAFCNALTTLPGWAKGLPLAAEGYRATYFKG